MLVGSGLATTATIAQQSQPGGDNERRESDDRRDRWRQFRRDRSDGDGNRSDDVRRSSSSDRGSTDRQSEVQPSMNMTDYAKGLVKQYDKNGNMMLEADERGELRGRAAAADLNNDKVITVDELVAGLSGNSSPDNSAASSGSAARTGESSDRRDRDRSSSFSFRRGDRDRDSDGETPRGDSNAAVAKRVFAGSAGGSQTGEADKNKRRSYRFTPPVDRLPTGLPSWFKSRDKNGDAQVAMSEYSRSWSSRLVAEFRRYDTNDDGIITPKEVAK